MDWSLTPDDLEILEHFAPGVELTGEEAVEVIPACSLSAVWRLHRAGKLARHRGHSNVALYARADH